MHWLTCSSLPLRRLLDSCASMLSWFCRCFGPQGCTWSSLPPFSQWVGLVTGGPLWRNPSLDYKFLSNLILRVSLLVLSSCFSFDAYEDVASFKVGTMWRCQLSPSRTPYLVLILSSYPHSRYDSRYDYMCWGPMEVEGDRGCCPG